MSFEVTILGSGAALPTAQRNLSAQFVQCNDRHILIDCGEGTQHQIRRYSLRIQKIKYILISHLHGDHYFGLIGLLSTMNLLGRDKDIHLFAPAELKEIIDLQVRASGHKYGFDLHFKALRFDEPEVIFEDRCIEIHSIPLDHRVPTCGFMIREKEKDRNISGARLQEDNVSLQAIPFFRKGLDYQDENGKIYRAATYSTAPKPAKSYVYYSDTAPNHQYAEYIAAADVLYHEATFTESMRDRARNTKHSTAAQAADFARKAQVKQLYLGHLSSRYDSVNAHLDEAQQIFQATQVVSDGLTFQV